MEQIPPIVAFLHESRLDFPVVVSQYLVPIIVRYLVDPDKQVWACPPRSHQHTLWFIYSSGKALVELTAWTKSSHLTGEAGCIPSCCRGFFSLTFHYGCVQTQQWVEHKSEVHEPSTASAIINTSPVVSIDLAQIDSITEESSSRQRIAQLSKL